MKNQYMEWEKIFANHIYDKGLISKLYKELIQLNSKKKSNLRRWFKEMERYTMLLNQKNQHCWLTTQSNL